MEQADLSLIALLKGPDFVREDVLRSFGDDETKAIRAAIRWAWVNRRVRSMHQRVAAMHTGIKAPHLSNILNGKKYLPPDKINAFEWIVGNRAVSMTIDRFRTIREQQSALDLARAIVGAKDRAAQW